MPLKAPRRGLRARLAITQGASDLLADRLRPHLRRSLTLRLTDNRRDVIAVRREPHRLHARVHRMFTRAPEGVVRALADYLETSDEAASRRLDRYIDDRPWFGIERRAPAPLTTRGQWFDLQEVFDHLNRRDLGGRVQARIAWGPRRTGGGRERRSLRMGSYSVEDRLIRVHPALDRAFVPRYFLEWIVFHEMLHAVHDIPTRNGRRIFHTPAFLAHERSFPHYRLAREWERRNIDRLLDF